jgi:hypothetical protein
MIEQHDTSGKIHKCNVCTKIVSSSRHLLTHNKNLHGQNKKHFKCYFCHKDFQHKQSMLRHLNFLHIGERPFKCEKCFKSFCRTDSLSIHKVVSSIMLHAFIKIDFKFGIYF